MTPISTGPKIVSAVKGEFNINIEVNFDAYMLDNTALMSTSSYRLSHGAYVTNVQYGVSEYQIILTAEHLYGNRYITLLVSPLLSDQLNNLIDPEYSQAVIDLGDDSASISGPNGLLRTRNDINAVYEDNLHWYFATSGGIDVVTKAPLENIGYVLDAYGANTVIAAADGYIYFDTSDPTDGYYAGIYKVERSSLNGNSTSNKIEAFIPPNIMSPNINHLYRGDHSGSDVIVVSTDNGASVFEQDRKLHYSVGNNIGVACLDAGGTTLYLANNTLGQVEVYYNIDINTEQNIVPDAYYGLNSSPELSGSIINQIIVIDDMSIMDPESNRLYVGTDNGLTRIDTDESDPGYSESGGLSFTYGTYGSGMVFDILGGQTNNVIAVDVNVNILQIFVLTNDDYGDGGLTTINIPTNTRFDYKSYELGTLISNDLRDISFKNLSS